MNTEQLRAEFEAWISSPPYEKPLGINPESSGFPGQYKAYEVQLAWEAYQAGRAALQSQDHPNRLGGVMDNLFCDLKTDEEKAAFFLSGRGYETGVISQAIQNDVAMTYHRCVEYKKELEALQSQDREDALRYRWLRNRASAEGICVAHIDYWSEEYRGQAHCEVYDGEFLDKAIDRARRIEGEGE